MWRTAGDETTITWSAVETGSGIRGYDLEVSADGGASWTRLLTATQATTYTFSGTPGVAYTFRVRATDNVNNTSAWVQAEAKTVVVKKYYSVADQRVAMRENGVLYYLHTDHLGSASLTTDAADTIHAQQRYFPYGETRWSSGTLPTDRQFTSQRREAALGIYDHKARFYSPRLGRFLSADTLVPNPAKPQLFNRYSYAGNNPVLYNDPDGHCGPLCWAAIGLTLFGMSLLVTADTRLPPEQAPSPVQGLVGWTSIGLGFGAVFAPEAIAAAGTAACGDGDCTNEVQMGIEAGQKVLDTASADGDPTNEAQATVRVFWSGGDVARRAAQDWAQTNNGTTLEMTEVGQGLEETTRGLDWLTQARPQWVAASREFAAGASGEVHVFQNSAGVSLQSIWATVEYPVLMSNPNVTRIVYHVVLPNGQVVIMD